jgi:hypothetical protein
MIKEYSEELENDIDFLKENSIEQKLIDNYIDRYKKFFSSWLNAKSNCTSPMITGPANYNVRRHEKTQRSEQKHYEVFREWRERAKKAIIRKSQPEKTFLSELERYKLELESLKANHELMKQGNKRISAAKKTGEDITKYLTDTFKIQAHMLDWTMRFGFGLQNNLANIKRVEDRIKILEKKEDIKNNVGNTENTFIGFKVVQNIEIDRLQIIHDARPEPSVIQLLKSNGFKWSPSQQAWQRQLTGNAIFALKRLLPQLTKLD